MQRSGAIVQKPEGPNTYDLKMWLSPSGNLGTTTAAAADGEASEDDPAAKEGRKAELRYTGKSID